jgi:hypothetical protein
MSHEFKESDVQRALEQIMEKNGGVLPKQRNSLPPGARMTLHTNAGIFQTADVFEAKTVKGNTNYVIFGMDYNGWVYYFHSDKAKRVPSQKFKDLIDYGDLVPVKRGEVDPERIALSVLGMSAMANGLSFNDYLKVIYNYGPGSQAHG